MKRIFAIASIAVIALASCSKKEENKLMDSNTMLEEPEVIITDTVKAKPTTAVVEAPVAVTDSTAVN